MALAGRAEGRDCRDDRDDQLTYENPEANKHVPRSDDDCAELLKRTFGIDVLRCSKCEGAMWLVAMVTEPKSVARYLSAIGELTRVPERSPSPWPPYWQSVVLRRKALGGADAA